MIKGISVCNPVDLDREYLLYTAEYAIEKGMDHYQFIGPIHNPEKGNIDGMIFYRKYAQFNGDKNAAYVQYAMQTANEVCEKLSAHGVKTYMWHHELELPVGFEEAYPEVCNDYGDVEVSHPLVKDFLENKIGDFFATYPKMDGIILTLHETRIPLLKLKNQKLGKIERVKYVTQILFDACAAQGKELIVRPFASIEEDYEMMTKAYEQISTDMMIMDKWIQFDWSLTLPENAFFKKIKNNPLFVETDIFGEYFGKGFLPIMLKKHITEKYAYCQNFSPAGYVSRIDRGGYHSFGTVNEVNLRIMEACLEAKDVEKAIDDFFSARYGEAGDAVRELMENTEEIQKKILYVNGYYYSELSRFPRLNHCKNHFYFEMMKEDYTIASNEWFIPKGWSRGALSDVLKEKQTAVLEAKAKLDKLAALKNGLQAKDYFVLERQFLNLYFVARLWQELTNAFIAYARYFETHDHTYETQLETALQAILAVDEEGKARLGNFYYPTAIGRSIGDAAMQSVVERFVVDVRRSFAAEKETTATLEKQDLVDFIVCGGGNEGHKLQKEVNFSDTYVTENGVCRIPGTDRGRAFSTVNAHGWFSYEITITPYAENKIVLLARGSDGNIHYSVDVNGETTLVREKSADAKETVVCYKEERGETIARIRIDRISSFTPFIYTIKVLRG